MQRWCFQKSLSYMRYRGPGLLPIKSINLSMVVQYEIWNASSENERESKNDDDGKCVRLLSCYRCRRTKRFETHPPQNFFRKHLDIRYPSILHTFIPNNTLWNIFAEINIIPASLLLCCSEKTNTGNWIFLINN